MAARFSHASATPSVLDLTIRGLKESQRVPVRDHTTDYGEHLRYVIGVKFRRASLELMLLTKTQYDQFKSFYQTVTNANTRFTFVPDNTNFPGDSYSAFFVSEPDFDRINLPGQRMAWTVSVDIEDAPGSL